MPLPLEPQGGQSPLEILAESAVQVGAVLVPGTRIVSVLLTQRIDDKGDLVDVMMIGYTIDGLPGTFFVHPGADYRWGEATPAYITRRKAEIESIYGLGEA
jgi:hypothetical protein